MKLDIKTLKLGIIKNLRNSQELLDEAEILFENQKYARTYLLSHIAIEECSKCVLLLKILAFYIWEFFQCLLDSSFGMAVWPLAAFSA